MLIAIDTQPIIARHRLCRLSNVPVGPRWANVFGDAIILALAPYNAVEPGYCTPGGNILESKEPYALSNASQLKVDANL
jgi:hypothetical protein